MSEQLAPPRLPDWEARLNALVAERRREAFAWGRVDCALWAADAVHAMTGADFGEPFRGKYTDAEGAALALREYGAGTLTRTFDRHLERTLPSLAKRGDLVKVPRSSGAPMGAIGVCMGPFGLFVSDLGLERRVMADWSLAWKV